MLFTVFFLFFFFLVTVICLVIHECVTCLFLHIQFPTGNHTEFHIEYKCQPFSCYCSHTLRKYLSFAQYFWTILLWKHFNLFHCLSSIRLYQMPQVRHLFITTINCLEETTQKEEVIWIHSFWVFQDHNHLTSLLPSSFVMGKSVGASKT